MLIKGKFKPYWFRYHDLLFSSFCIVERKKKKFYIQYSFVRCSHKRKGQTIGMNLFGGIDNEPKINRKKFRVKPSNRKYVYNRKCMTIEATMPKNQRLHSRSYIECVWCVVCIEHFIRSMQLYCDSTYATATSCCKRILNWKWLGKSKFCAQNQHSFVI